MTHAIERLRVHLEETLAKIVQIVCSTLYREFDYVLSDNLGQFANQPNVNICLQKKTSLPHFLICLQGLQMQADFETAS